MCFKSFVVYILCSHRGGLAYIHRAYVQTKVAISCYVVTAKITITPDLKYFVLIPRLVKYEEPVARIVLLVSLWVSTRHVQK